MLFGFLYAAYVENVVKLSHHALNIFGRETAIFHSVDNIALASAVALPLSNIISNAISFSILILQ